MYIIANGFYCICFHSILYLCLKLKSSVLLGFVIETYILVHLQLSESKFIDKISFYDISNQNIHGLFIIILLFYLFMYFLYVFLFFVVLQLDRLL